MVNLLHICESMTKRWYREDELCIPLETLKKFAEKNGFEMKKKLTKKQRKYKLFRQEIPVFFISGEEESNIKILDIADLHIGSPDFDEEAFRSTLAQAVRDNVTGVFIAGDIFNGVSVEGNALSAYSNQIRDAYQIFKDYPLKYYAINGNHDYTFEQLGMCNPIKALAKQLNEGGIEFHFFDTYLIDFIIAGVVKRVMHVERQDFTKKRIFAIEKLKQFENENGLTVFYEGKEYPIRLFQAGHIHINIQMYYARRKIYISQSGSFLKNDESEEMANFITAKVIDKKVFMC